MKRILFVLPFLPYPLTSGGHQAIFNGIAAAAATGADCHLAYPDYDDREEDRQALARALDGKIRILPYPVRLNRRGDKALDAIYRIKYVLKKMIKGEAAARPVQSPYEEWLRQMMPRQEAYCRFINDIVDQYAIDTVQCEMLDTLALALTLPGHVRKYFVHHELGFVRKGLHPIIGREPLSGGANLAINKTVEVSLLNLYDTVITLSEIDTEKLREAGVTTRIHTSFATVGRCPETSLETTCDTELSFVGPEMHPANKEGVRWFLENCWERLLAANPAYRLRIVGAWTEETRREMCARYRHIDFPGYVPDLAAAIKNTVMIVPILTGSGIRMKILEAALIGVPVVTTGVGVEGIPLVSGESCFIADTPDAFIQALRDLSDRSLRERFIHSAQRIIADRYSRQALEENRGQLYR